MFALFRHCPRCATALVERRAGERRRPTCPSCGYVQYLNPAVGVAVIVREGRRVLLGRRRGSYGGAWCIPCGYVEWEEDVRAAAVREFREETGLEVAVDRPYEVHSNFHNPAQHTVGVWFLGHVVGGAPEAADDLEALAYFDLDALPEDLCFPTDRLVLARLKEEVDAGG
jgi:ADP-ribose pyrophosphatase YjhB (NUDIX family)